jgi:hypothetical protein
VLQIFGTPLSDGAQEGSNSDFTFFKHIIERLQTLRNDDKKFESFLQGCEALRDVSSPNGVGKSCMLGFFTVLAFTASEFQERYSQDLSRENQEMLKSQKYFENGSVVGAGLGLVVGIGAGIQQFCVGNPVALKVCPESGFAVGAVVGAVVGKIIEQGHQQVLKSQSGREEAAKVWQEYTRRRNDSRSRDASGICCSFTR